MSDLERLAAKLTSELPSSLLGVIATYPRSSRTGKLDIQGFYLDVISQQIIQEATDVEIFRVLWSQIALLITTNNPDSITKKIKYVIAKARNEEIEIRAILVFLDSGAKFEIFDELQAELSERRDFGKVYRSNALRIIDETIIKN